MALSPLVKFGTSTWTYEGWQGQVYKYQYAKSKFVQECLGEYCQYQHQGQSLFRTVGNDSTFYRPPTANQLRRFLHQIPEDFERCFKVWEEITIPSYANQARYGPRTGQPNPRFLDAKSSTSLCSHRIVRRNSSPMPAPSCSSFSVTVGEFCIRLDGFLDQLPKNFRYAIEIRNPGLLGPAYHKVLETHGVAHVYNHWSSMPALADQHTRLGSFTVPFTVLRLLTPLKMSHEAAKKRASPTGRLSRNYQR